jgi:hypothetical protein
MSECAGKRHGGTAGRALARLALALSLLAGCEDGEKKSGVRDAMSSDDAVDAAGTRDASSAPSLDAAAPFDAAPTLDATAAADATGEREASVSLRPGAPGLCARAGDDQVRDVFCTEDPSSITSLRQLQLRLALNAYPATVDDATAAAYQPDPDAQIDGLVFLGHSTALSGQIVSPINPRVLLLGQNTFMAFQRGVQQVELAAFDRNTHALNLYLVRFRQACNQRAAGCLPGDLYTPNIERDWSEVTIQDAEDLKNTPADCRQCHQRVRGQALLLMRELRGPWTHFFSTREDPAVRAYQAAKGNEIYAGVPSSAMAHTAGFSLQARVDVAQPLEFPSPDIEEELASHDPTQGPRRSATWDKAYQAFKRGEQLPMPYFEPVVTDPQKQAKLLEAYQRYRAGQLPAEQLPDLADVFPDDPQVRAEIGLVTEPGATPVDALIQACGPCHNDKLDQSISRARFNIALGRISRAERELAIARLELPAGSEGVMPPPETRQLDAAARTRLIAYLRQDARPEADDALLNQAGRQGMAKDPWEGLIVGPATDMRDY